LTQLHSLDGDNSLIQTQNTTSSLNSERLNLTDNAAIKVMPKIVTLAFHYYRPRL